MTLISIDPGKTYAAIAEFRDGKLFSTSLLPKSMVRALPRDVALVLVDHARHLPRTHTGDQQMTLISIDPGKTYAAVAQFSENGKLFGTAVFPRTTIRTLPRDVALVLVEKPWGVRQASHGADIRELCLSAGEYKGHFDNAEWRNAPSIPKPIRHRMAWNALDDAERNLLPSSKSARGHVLCAVWQGLKELGRV